MRIHPKSRKRTDELMRKGSVMGWEDVCFFLVRRYVWIVVRVVRAKRMRVGMKKWGMDWEKKRGREAPRRKGRKRWSRGGNLCMVLDVNENPTCCICKNFYSS